MKKHISIITMAFVSLAANSDPSSQTTVDNGDGTFTYTQRVDESSSAPHYIAPNGYGFEEYSWFNEDYGWQHSFADYNTSGLQILSATMLIRGWDVDSETFHGASGEYDGISVDGVDLNPGLLQGQNEEWSETTFTIPTSNITDDGLINVFLDIDMNHTSRTWATTLDYSLLTITYTFTENNAPNTPELVGLPAGCIDGTTDLSVNIGNSANADPDGDPVTYTYRWYVDVGQGYLIDDEFAGKTNHTGNTVLASQVLDDEIWRVEVIAVDDNGLSSDPVVYTWNKVNDCDGDGIDDDNDDYPEDSERAFNNESTPGTLIFEDNWPSKGDFDLNDFVLTHSFNVITNASNEVKEVTMTAAIQGRGASKANSFAIAMAGTTDENVAQASFSIAGVNSTLTPEAGHSEELVLVIVENANQHAPSTEGFSFFNTEQGDDRAEIPVTMRVVFTQAVNRTALGAAPFNPFIYSTFERGNEIHLPNHTHTALADTSKFGTADDNTSIGGETYMTASGLPWAVDIIESGWKHPYERVDISIAYPTLKNWVESNKSTHGNWYTLPASGKCWKCNQLVFPTRLRVTVPPSGGLFLAIIETYE